MIPKDLALPCPVAGCGRLQQAYETQKSSGRNTFLKTCSRHSYKDLEAQQKPTK